MEPLVVKIAMPVEVESFADGIEPVTAAAIEAAWMHRLQASFEIIMFPLRFDAERKEYIGDGCPPFWETVGERFDYVAKFDEPKLKEIAGALLEGRKVTPEYVYKYRASRAAASLVRILF